MSDQFSRSRMLLGDGPQERLFHASVALFGVGGVGGFCAEALARAGIGALDPVSYTHLSFLYNC